MRTVSFILTAWLATLADANAAEATDCKPLQLINSIKLESIDNGRKFLVPVTINGTPEKFVLDTGGYTSQITHKAAAALGLHEEETRDVLFNLYGDSSHARVTVDDFGLGQQTGHKIVIHVSPFATLDQEGTVAGLLSTNLFLLYDIDLDFGAERLNYFSQDHCDGRVAYWPEQPLAVVPFELDGWHINFPVTVDGHEVQAVMDTGADGTVMPDTVAKEKFALSLGSGDTPLAETSQPDLHMKYYIHKFDNLSVAGLSVSNLNVLVMTDRMGAGAPVFKSSFRGTTSDPYNRMKIKREDLIIGMDVLQHLHVYIAYKEKRLYISPAGTGESVLFKSSAAPAK